MLNLPNLPMIPMIKILADYAYANNIQLNPRNLESILRCFEKYKIDAQLLN